MIVFEPEYSPSDMVQWEDMENGDSIPKREKPKIPEGWMAALEVMSQMERTDRAAFSRICYLLTRLGLRTGFAYMRGSGEPCAAGVADALTYLESIRMISEDPDDPDGRGLLVTDRFAMAEEEMNAWECGAIEQVRNMTDRLETVSVILYSWDDLNLRSPRVDASLLEKSVLDWRRDWRNSRDSGLKDTIRYLEEIGWIRLENENSPGR